MCSNETGQLTYLCKTFVLTDKICRISNNYFCRDVAAVYQDCTEPSDFTCRAYLIDECLNPPTSECVKIVNGDSQCRDMTQN
jgi:hypothetical protein